MQHPRRSAASLALMIAATLAAALLAPAAAQADGQATEQAGRARADQPTLRVGSYNIQSSRSLAEFQAGVAALKPLVDVMGLQEIGANEKHQSLQRDHDWGYYRPPATQQDPVLWRRDHFDFRSADGALLSKKRRVSNAYGHGDLTIDANYASVVRLVERASGERVTFINVHLVHGATQAGRPKPGRRALFGLYTDQVAALAKVAAREKAASDDVYVLGDFNVGYAADARFHLKKLPYHRLRGVGLTSMWRDSPYLGGKHGTHGTQLIDQVWTVRAAESARIQDQIQHSDHRPVVATYRLPVPDAGYAPTEGTVGFADPMVAGCEMDRPFQKPTLRFELVGDLAHGFAGVEVVDGTGAQGTDFTVDDSSLYDNDLRENHVLVSIVPNKTIEPDKTFVLNLVGPTNTAITVGQGTSAGLIVDDDKLFGCPL